MSKSGRATIPTDSRNWRPLMVGTLIILLTVLAYLPALRGGFIWDDDDYVTQNRTLRDAEGLRQVWFKVGVVPQYYPLVHTTYWLEHQLWKLRPLGYHLDNVLLHALAAILLGRVLTRLQVPGAWLAAAIFALHPVHVESVAWITERKNVLCAVFYFASALWYLPPKADLPFTIHHSPFTKRYCLSLLLFVAAMLSKTVACSLPAALLLVCWWKTGRVRARDAGPLVPFFAIGLGLGLLTAWVEKTNVGAHGPDWSQTFLERCLIAGRAVWFYAGKLVWPANLTFIYPRWEISAALWWQWLFPLTALAVVAVLWFARKSLGRGPLTAALFFAGTLGPALGFVNVYPMRYSFVADHFQYLASAGLIALLVGAAARAPISRFTFQCCAGIVVFVCLGLTWRQCRSYRDLETLWRDTLERNPACWMAHNNLGQLLAERGQWSEAREHYFQALKLKPGYADALNNLGSASLEAGRTDEAMDYFQRALQSQPDLPDALNNLGSALLAKDRVDEAIAQFRAVLRRHPHDAHALNNLGAALAGRKQFLEALACYEASVRADPDNVTARFNVASVLLQMGRTDEALARFGEVTGHGLHEGKFHREFAHVLALQGRSQEAVAQYREALRLSPHDAAAHYGLGVLLGGVGQTADAIEQYRLAILSDPNHAEARNNLGVALTLTGQGAEAVQHFNEALRLNPNYAEAHNNLAFALIQLGRRDEAIAHLREALRLKPDYEQARQQLRGLGTAEAD